MNPRKSMNLPPARLALLLTFVLTLPSFAQQGKTQAEAKDGKYPLLPAAVERKEVTIWSDGTRMAGDLYLPKDRKPEDKFPAIVFIAGTGGTKKGSPARMAPIFVKS